MRICLVSQEYPPETASGGIGSQTYTKAHGLAALGHEVSVISASPDLTDYQCEDGPVRVQRIGGYWDRMPLNTEPARWITYSAEIAAALHALNTRQPLDLIDFPEWGCEGYVYLLNRTQWDRVPVVIQLHGPLVMFAHTMGWPEVDSEFYRTGTAMEGTCLRLADAIYSSGACSTEWSARHYGLAAERIPTIHSGVDSRLFRPPAARGNGPCSIVFAGRVDSNKGVDILMRAACILARQHPSLRLRILGGGDTDFIRELCSTAEAAGFPALLDFVGFVPTADLPGYLGLADIFAVPSVFEGGPGFAYLEAMACGVPVVGCEGSGGAEVIRHGENGLLVPPRDVDALAAGLGLLLSSPDMRKSMGERGRRFVEEHADSRVCVARLAAFYCSVIEGESSFAGMTDRGIGDDR